jgi:hypothetical protein
MADYEVWDTRSGNMLMSDPDPDEVWVWLRDFRARHGDEALDGLSVGIDVVQVASGGELRDILDAGDTLPDLRAGEPAHDAGSSVG